MGFLKRALPAPHPAVKKGLLQMPLVSLVHTPHGAMGEPSTGRIHLFLHGGSAVGSEFLDFPILDTFGLWSNSIDSSRLRCSAAGAYVLSLPLAQQSAILHCLTNLWSRDST